MERESLVQAAWNTGAAAGKRCPTRETGDRQTRSALAPRMGTVAVRKPLLFILLGAFLLRGGLAIALQSRLDRQPGRRFLIEGDAAGYWELGEKLAKGESYAIYDPPRQALRMPGYPAFLAVAIKLTELLGLDATRGYFVGRLLQAAVGTLACALVYILGRDLVDARTGLIAAGIAAVMPTLAVFSVELLSETLFAVTVLANLIVLGLLSGDRPASRQKHELIVIAVVAGACVAIANYVRPSWLLFGFCFASAFVLAGRGIQTWRFRVALGGILLLSMFLLLAPWAYRNQRVTGHWVFTTLWVGPSLYDGLNPNATGDSDMEFYDNDPQVPKMSEYEVDQYFRQKAWAFVRENPGRALELSFIKLWRFWKPWPNAAEFNRPLYAAVVALSFLPMLAFAFVGAWICRREFWVLFLTAGPILYFSAIHMVFLGSLRYRLPVEYPLCVLSAIGVKRFWRRW